MRRWWRRLRNAQKKIILVLLLICLIEGGLGAGIIVGRGLQSIFWVRWNSMVAKPQIVKDLPYTAIINTSGAYYNLDPTLIAAVIRCESDFNARAVSEAGAIGLMQICLPTWRGLKEKDPTWTQYQNEQEDIQALYQPQINIDAGTKYLQLMLIRYQGNVVKAVAAYNAGPSSVDKYNGVPPYPETVRYVQHVAAVWAIYRGLKGTVVDLYLLGSRIERWAINVQGYTLIFYAGVLLAGGMIHWRCRYKRSW